MAIQQPPSTPLKADVEVVFRKAFGNMLERIGMFERGQAHLRFLFSMAASAAFYKINTHAGIREFFNTNFIESQNGKDHAREMLDYLQSMMFEFRLRLREAGGGHYRDFTNNIAQAYGEWAQPSSNTSTLPSDSQKLSVLPEDNRVYASDGIAFALVLEQNGWYLALLLIRLYALNELYRIQPPPSEEPKRNV